MNPKGFTYFLILLVCSAMADDSWSWATSDPDDDVLTSLNNEYVRAPGVTKPSAPGKEAVLGGPNSGAAYCPVDPLSSRGQTEKNPPPLPDSDPLYAFMSLQR
jgi:hypothetical protein